MSGYTKLFPSLIHSTIWRAPNHVRLVWITMLAITDRDGVVQASVPGLADAARVTLQECEQALAELSAPDHYSRTRTDEGRRIREVDGGWELINHDKYRDQLSADDRREKDAIRQAKKRAREKHVTDRDSHGCHVTERDSHGNGVTSHGPSENIREVPHAAAAAASTQKKEIPPPPSDEGTRPESHAPRIAAHVAFSDPAPGPGQGTPQTQNASSVAPSASNPIPRGLGGDPRKRPDVQELHALWQSTFGMPATKFRGGHSDQSADTLAIAIDACGLEACKLALKHAATEPGVKGELDGTGNVHSSIRYLFGNEDTLPRLLKHAEERERRIKPPRMTRAQAVEKLASLPPDSDEARKLREKLKRAEEREQSSWQPSSVMGSGLR